MDFKWLRGDVVLVHCSLRGSVEGFDHAMQFRMATDLWENLKEAVSVDQIKRLCEIHESDVQGHLRIPALLLLLSKGESLLLTIQVGSNSVTLVII